MLPEKEWIPEYSPRTGSVCLIILFFLMSTSCKPDPASRSSQSNDPKSEILVKRRNDGTLSSVNQIDENGYVHGLRVTYYSDGKTIYSKLSLDHGIKSGPYIRYYRNGQIFEYHVYKEGKKHGPARKYYRNGKLLAEYYYKNGNVLPGLKEYDQDGTLVTDYPEIRFEEVDHLESWNRVDLKVYSDPVYPGIKYYLKHKSHGQESRIYLISENGSALTQHFIKPGETLLKKIEIIADIPTKFGNILVKEPSYDLSVSNSPLVEIHKADSRH